MKIKTKNPNLRAWADRNVCPELVEPVEFDENGTATVSAEVGRAMIDAFPRSFSEIKPRSAKKS